MNIIIFLKSIYRHARRLYFLKFNSQYIRESIGKRKGECKHCGCCRREFRQCPHFKDGKDCAKFPDFPQVCKIYPFDEKDKNEFSKIHCGFYWESGK